MLSRIRKTRTIIASRTPTAPPRPSSNVQNSVVRFPTVRCNCRRDTCCRRLPVLRLCPFDESSATLAESVWRQPISSIVEHCCLRTVAPCKFQVEHTIPPTTGVTTFPLRHLLPQSRRWLRQIKRKFSFGDIMLGDMTFTGRNRVRQSRFGKR